MAVNIPTSNTEINQVVTSFSEGISSIFGEKLIGVYLFGSLSYGDFNIESSDIDVVTILKESANKFELDSLKELHHEIEAKYPKWAKRIESSYTPQYMLSEKLPPKEPRPYYGEGIFYTEALYGNEWIINLYLLYKHGIAIIGPSFKNLVSSIDIQNVQAACMNDLFKEWEPKLREPEWLDNSHYQSYLVMNLCRILNTILSATALSKKKSADFVKQQFPQWSELIEEAENWHSGLEMNRKEEALQFLRFVIMKVNNHKSKFETRSKK